MKLSRFEKAAAIIALCFVVLLVGYIFGTDRSDGTFTVYTESDAAEASGAESDEDTQQNTTSADEVLFPLDINAATVDQLAELPGIGETLAKRIVEYREENGEFEVIEDIINVYGIGEKKFEGLAEYIIADKGSEE